jgi:hypothetical protein
MSRDDIILGLAYGTILAALLVASLHIIVGAL